ncbi:hypothetical protein JVU11DRAFT_8929 [Chiua virens]|nr:hypothetical protein JVU11DRAFT_8929 [Chiua virens]
MLISTERSAASAAKPCETYRGHPVLLATRVWPKSSFRSNNGTHPTFRGYRALTPRGTLLATRMDAARNVVLFGECGVGKSSVINTIVGKAVAETSNDVLGCTGENELHSVTLDTGVKINLWDTIGLNEGTLGRFPAEQAKRRLKLFLQTQITSSEGIDLLLYCIRGASGTKSLPIKQGYRETYKFVFEDICKKRVPSALIVTNLEAYDPNGDMDTWWDDNKAKLSEFGFQFCAHACITILPRESWDTHLDYSRIEVSRHRLQELLSCNYLAPRNVLLLGDRIDRADFIDMTIDSASNNSDVQKPEGVPPLAFTSHPVVFNTHTHINLWNMNGFDETDDDILITGKSLRLIAQGMKRTGGIDLLLFCFRAGRLRIRHARNYNLFYAAICRKKVLVAMVVLGPEEGADTWWERNEQDVGRRGFRFDRHLYIPCGPFPHGDDLGPAARDQLIRLIQEEHTLGSWKLDDNAFWVTVPNVRACGRRALMAKYHRRRL